MVSSVQCEERRRRSNVQFSDSLVEVEAGGAGGDRGQGAGHVKTKKCTHWTYWTHWALK